MEGLWGTFLTLILVYPAAYLIPGTYSTIQCGIVYHGKIKYIAVLYSTVCIVYVLIVCLHVIFCLCICVYVLVLFCCFVVLLYYMCCLLVVLYQHSMIEERRNNHV